MNEEYEFFWRGPFSQWYKADMYDSITGITFNCCEQYMMYNKAKLFKDDKIAQKILETKNPRDQKNLGRQVKNFDNDLWRSFCEEIVYRANFLKFTQNIEIRATLLGTGTKRLVEASPYDTVWGIGLDEETAKKACPNAWRGENLLGKALDRVKADIVLVFSEVS